MRTKMMMMVKEQRPSTGFPELMLVSAGFQSTASAHLISSTYHPSIKGEHCKLNNHGQAHKCRASGCFKDTQHSNSISNVQGVSSSSSLFSLLTSCSTPWCLKVLEVDRRDGLSEISSKNHVFPHSFVSFYGNCFLGLSILYCFFFYVVVIVVFVVVKRMRTQSHDDTFGGLMLSQKFCNDTSYDDKFFLLCQFIEWL